MTVISAQWAKRSLFVSRYAACVLLLGLAVALACLPTQGAEPAGDEFPRELVEFAPYEGNPVFTGRGPGCWDAEIRERGWILRDGDLWQMWYSGYRAPYGETNVKLGYATSADGLTWKRYRDEPIFDECWIEDMVVVKHEGVCFMLAETGNDNCMELLTSDDGLDWQRQGKVDILRQDGQPLGNREVGTPTLWREDGRWYLLYEIDVDRALMLATSDDLKTWTNVQDAPVLLPGPEPYDENMIAANQVVPYQGRYYLYYHGWGATNGNNWTTNVAVSTDLLHWKKYPKNPLLPVGENKSSGILVHDGAQYRLYTMHEQVHVHLLKKAP